MKKTILILGLALSAAIFVWAQRERVPAAYVAYEVRSVFPRETSPGEYAQVSQAELQALAQQGWELVGVMPYIYRNEEHGPELHGPKPVVTQSYPAYFFKRTKTAGARE